MQTETVPNRQIAEFKAGLVQLAQSLNPTFFTTIRFNNPGPLAFRQAERLLSLFSARIDRLFIGRSYANLPDDQRTRFLAIPEGRRSHRPESLDGFHYHIVLSLPPQPKRSVDQERFAHLVATAWKKYVPAGDTDVRPIVYLPGAVSYPCKHIKYADFTCMRHYVVGPMSNTEHRIGTMWEVARRLDRAANIRAGK